MQLVYQAFPLFYFVMEGPIGLLIFTLVSFVLTVIGALLHRATYSEITYGGKENLSESKKGRYRWLNVTAIILVSALPTSIAILVNYVGNDHFSNDSMIWIIMTCMNLPGIIYFLQAISAQGRKVKDN